MGRDPYAKWDKQSRIGYVLAAALLVLLLLTAWAAWYAIFRAAESSRRSKGGDDVRSLLHHLVEDRLPEGRRPWPPYSGRSFVLSVVADGRLDPRTPGALRLLFPRDGPPAGIAAEDYAGVTHEALRARRFPQLTSLAGRRNAEPDARIPTGPAAAPTVVVGWLGVEDGAVVGWSNGAVQFLDRAALGLDHDDPIEVGRHAKSPILRLLSDE